jgi:glycogen phosphorylase
MYNVRTFKVVPSLPTELACLHELAYNLYWTWNHEIRNLFQRLDRDLWEQTGHDPIRLLGSIDQKRLEIRAKDEGFVSHLHRAKQKLDDYLKRKTWFQEKYGADTNFRIAYFSMEYGITEGIPTYSGGLGVLAADHLKAASDLGVPLVAVGLLYQQGYFNQYLSKDGWQQESYVDNDFYNMPIKRLRDKDGQPIMISVQMQGREIKAQIWQAQVGRVPLYLLDTNVEDNLQKDQDITDQLYGGDNEMRIKQEIVLGIGGIRALEKVGIRPHVCHMNEGHSAFMALERARILMQESKVSFNEAVEATRSSNVFTSHTPVPAGIDEFEPNLLDSYLSDYYNSLNISQHDFHSLGGVHRPETGGKFNMAIFAIQMAGGVNGVSRLHGKVARKMWNYLWPELPEDEVPIGHVTNGIHIPTWISADMAELYSRYLGPRWIDEPANTSVWDRVQTIPDEELWRTHERRRERLVAYARKQLRRQLENAGANPSDIAAAQEVLDPEVLTIGFARRFAEYKRAKLLFHDMQRLSKIVNNKECPVQFIIAGKAHPRDNVGKAIIRDIIGFIRNEEFRPHIVFLEDYDMEVAANMLQGVDVWLNTPRRPREASGTSGMKAAVNGAINLSVLDGWWDEAFRNTLGWSIGRGEEYPRNEDQDKYEADALYHALEHDIVPLFYSGGTGLPREWIRIMKSNIQRNSPTYNTNRMVAEYYEKYYGPSVKRWNRLSGENLQAAKALAKWKERVRQNWSRVQIVNVDAKDGADLKVGQSYEVKAQVNLDGFKPEEIKVEVFYGPLNADGLIIRGKAQTMEIDQKTANSVYWFKTSLPCEQTGQQGFSVRVTPNHNDIAFQHEMGLIKWFKE